MTCYPIYPPFQQKIAGAYQLPCPAFAALLPLFVFLGHFSF